MFREVSAAEGKGWNECTKYAIVSACLLVLCSSYDAGMKAKWNNPAMVDELDLERGKASRRGQLG
jgi:hypothetical protein